MTQVRGDPGWRVLQVDGALVATAGTDEVWLIDDVPGDCLAEISRCWSDDPPAADDLGPTATRAVEQLRALGAIRTPLPARQQPQPGLSWCGEVVQGFCRELAHAGIRPAGSDPDLIMVVRSTGTWAELAELAATYLADSRPHLVVDLAAEHTIAIGPLGIPGHSACAGCLAGRVAARWGDPQPPIRPRSTQNQRALGIVAQLLAHQLDQAFAGGTELIDRQVSVDLNRLTMITSPVLRSARCPCARTVTDGRVELPWQ